MSQANLDEYIGDLITRIKRTYELILENKSPSKINAARDVLGEIAQVVQECAHFIAKYSETKSFCMLLSVCSTRVSHLPHRASTRQECFLRDSCQSFQLQFQDGQVIQEFRDRAFLDAHYDVQQTREDLSLDSLVCAGQVGLNMAKKCLDGTTTRTSILSEIIDWINRTDPAAPRIFWLHGQAGKGKSAIAHTVALQARNLGVVGSCFCCFARVR